MYGLYNGVEVYDLFEFFYWNPVYQKYNAGLNQFGHEIKPHSNYM